MIRTPPGAAATTALLSLALLATPLAAQMPETGAETVAFERTTSHDELLAFLDEVQSMTDRMIVRELTVTDQGRAMPLVVLGSPPPAAPGASQLSGKPTVFITGNVHGVERAGREGTLQLIRELTVGSEQALLERVNVIVVPSLNPDGAMNRSRTNSKSYDMNRDFVVMETPEIRAVIEEVITEYWPDLFVDVHNGGAYPYNLTYQATLHPAADPDLVAFARGPMYEAVEAHLATQDMRMFWYSGPGMDDETGEWFWRTTPPWTRKQHSYGGLQNMITLLFEIPGRWSLEEQADNAREGMIGLLHFVADHAEEVRSTVMTARRRTVESTDPVPVTVEESAYPGTVDFYVMQDGEEQFVTGTNRTLFVATETRERPWAYAFDGNLGDVAGLLMSHGVVVERLDEAATVRVERYDLQSIEWADEPYQNHLNATAEVETVAESMELPAGTYLVRMAQPSGRLVGELMEPDTDDSVLVWNFLDHSLPSNARLERMDDPFFLPIVRVMEPVAVPATVVEGG